MDTLLKEIGQVAVFLICAQTILHFRAKDSYEKYIKLLIRMMLLLLLAEPFLKLFDTKENGSFWDKIATYEQSMEEVMGSGFLQEEEIEQLLQGITRQKVEAGVEYVQAQEAEAQGGQTVETTARESQEPEDVIPQTPIIIEKIEVGGANGES